MTSHDKDILAALAAPAAPGAAEALLRIARALEGLAPASPPAPDFAAADAWHPDQGRSRPSPKSTASTSRFCAGSTACATF